MFRDKQGTAFKEGVLLRVRLEKLLPRLDAGLITGIIYGIPTKPLSAQLYDQLIVRRDTHRPYYQVRSMVHTMQAFGLTYPCDNIGRQDAVDELIFQASARKLRGVRRDLMYGVKEDSFATRELFVQKVIRIETFVWAT